MASPYEELEYVAEYMPDEGEAIVVARRDGEIVCEPMLSNDLRDGINDPRLYGHLVHANERLGTARTAPLWSAVVAFCWMTVAGYFLAGMGWPLWVTLGGLLVTTACGTFAWMRIRQRHLFEHDVYPTLRMELRHQQIDPFTLIGAVRQHPELRTLLDELIHCADPEAPLLTEPIRVRR